MRCCRCRVIHPTSQRIALFLKPVQIGFHLCDTAGDFFGTTAEVHPAEFIQLRLQMVYFALPVAQLFLQGVDQRFLFGQALFQQEVQTITATTPSGSRPAVTAHPEQKLLAPRPLFTAAREVKTVVPVSSVTPVTPPRPLRTGEQTAALWIAPYIDNQDVYHQPSSVFFVIKPSGGGTDGTRTRDPLRDRQVF